MAVPHFTDTWTIFDDATKKFSLLDSILGEFHNKLSATEITEIDRELGVEKFKVRMDTRFPDRAPLVAKEVVAQLRNALDYAIYAAGAQLSTIDSGRNIAFPFSDSKDGLKKQIKKYSEIPPCIEPVIHRIAPYAGGNDELCRLNKLRNTNEHRFIVPLVTATLTKHAVLNNMTGSGLVRVGYNLWDEKRQTVEFMTMPLNSNFDYEVAIGVRTVFSHPDIDNSIPALNILQSMMDQTQQVITNVEKEADANR